MRAVSRSGSWAAWPSTPDRPPLPLAELLLSKLQVVKINRKDILDALILLRGHALAETDAAGVNVPRILEHTSVDWGWWRTGAGNLDRLGAFVGSAMGPPAPAPGG